MSQLLFKPGAGSAIRWTLSGYCGEPGCLDPACACAVCGLPVGVPYDDLRLAAHDEDCGGGCPLCIDQVPFIMFERDGPRQAIFHDACFRGLLLETGGG